MKSILILIDGSENDTESLCCALAFARATGSRLTVLHPNAQGATLYTFAESVFAPPATAAPAEAAARAEAAFNTVCAGQTATFQVFQGDAAEAIAAAGYGHDLVIVERLSAEEGPQAAQLNAALFETGRPVMITPPTPPAAMPARIAIAWNGAAQSARSVRSALPLLQKAEDAVILLGSGQRDLPTNVLTAYLKDYGIQPHVEHYASDHLTARARGRALIAAVQAVGAGMLVAGAYGESGSADIAGLGRATKKIVTAAPFPVFLQA